MSTLVEKIVTIHRSLRSHGVPHAFGGALALAWCTQHARGTIDIDVNVFLGLDHVDDVLGAVPAGVTWEQRDRQLLERDGQARIWWESTPVDVFLNTTEFHAEASTRCRQELFGGDRLPFLSCPDLAVFKAFFNRDKDWVDLGEMAEAGTLDAGAVIAVLSAYLGADDERIDRLRALT